MTAAEIRQAYLDFFKSKGHDIVPSAPITVKNDPTLLFTNAGMNQFKDYFLGNRVPENPRIADTQKCLRVSGKHNDLEEVGVDTYHHTMFEMLGNWSFGDYFKTEAIAWSWELLTEVYKLDKNRLYVTIFEGDEKENLPKDTEAYNEWKKVVAEDRILLGNKKDNFWEMGDTGPCGPCTEIHVDCRTDEERKLVDGASLVNNDHPQVIEIWNNVFIQFNRKKDGSLEQLPAKHVDTGMGFERLVRVIQKKTSNYDTDVFTVTIAEVEKITGKKYDYSDSKEAVAFRVLADHIRAICFTIADGQLPSNTGAGYVIRRILRRAVRYYFSYLDYKKPLLQQLVPVLANQFANVFPELKAQEDFVTKVVHEEEEAFLRTLDKGLKRLDEYVLGLDLGTNSIGWALTNKDKVVDAGVKIVNSNEEIAEANSISKNPVKSLAGNLVFELYDTYGFPLDLTKLIVAEKNVQIDEEGFNIELQKQKDRSRAATAIDAEDWVIVNDMADSKFVGYTQLQTTTKIVKYRKVKAKGKEAYQIVLAETPFYAESGGQVGDVGSLTLTLSKGEGTTTLDIVNTKKENNLYIHFVEEFNVEADLSGDVIATVNPQTRNETTRNHSATHLLHAALRQVLGTHVAQKGSLVNDEHLRFDFSHFAKVTDKEILAIEKMVNEKIRENIPVVIKEMNKDEAVALGAMALFGEKYGDKVRVVIIDENYSIELCGGTHVGSTGELGFFKIKHETAVAAGVRRIEAVSGKAAEHFINQIFDDLHTIRGLYNNPKELIKQIENSIAEHKELKKKLESLEARQLIGIRKELVAKAETINTVSFVSDIIEVSNADALKKICVDLKNEFSNNYAVVLCANIAGKSFVAVACSNGLDKLDCSQIIKQHIAPLIKGGGGGNKTLATAGGQDVSNFSKIISTVKGLL